MPIKRLDTLLINQIAAGEVIERPASVVKELVENALDAGASRIDIYIEDGGRELIRVSDDGGGISEDELLLAIAPHATSKILKPDDLWNIHTMGFRGEALASIASISRMKITSKTVDASSAAWLQVDGDDVGPVAPCSRAPGTDIEVRNLFFNTPARRKFMKSASTEFGHIQRLINIIAMAHPGIAITLTHNNRKSMGLNASSQENRVKAVLGKDLTTDALMFQSDERGIKVWGLAAQPSLAKANSRYLYIYLNQRPIKDQRVMHAIREAYRGLMDPTRYPAVVLFLHINPELVDVNVHPNKSEVRFLDPNIVHGVVLACIRQRLLQEDLTPHMELPGAALRTMANSTGQSMTGAKHSGSRSGPSISLNPGRSHFDIKNTINPTASNPSYEEFKNISSSPLASTAPFESTASMFSGAHIGPRHLEIKEGYLAIEDDEGLCILNMRVVLEEAILEAITKAFSANQSIKSQRLLKPIEIGSIEIDHDRLITAMDHFLRLGFDFNSRTVPESITGFPEVLYQTQVDVHTIFKVCTGFEFPAVDASMNDWVENIFRPLSQTTVQHTPSPYSNRLTTFLLTHHRDRVTDAPNQVHAGAFRLSLQDLEKQFKRS